MPALSARQDERLLQKEENLKQALLRHGSIVIAYSGGTDSTYLADVAAEVLGEHLLLVLADSPSVPRAEFVSAVDYAQARGWNLEIIKTCEFDDEAFLRNDERRCYVCRMGMFRQMRTLAYARGIHAMAYGANMDDRLDPTRVGAVAARESNVESPLQEAGLHKVEIRALSERRCLPTARKAPFACLATRLPRGVRLSVDALQRIERVEDTLRALGFRQFRARHHGEVCRIELERDEFAKAVMPENAHAIVETAVMAGYRFAALDLAGYQTGSTT